MSGRALVIGGGIGGLAAGLALRRIGWEARVLERAPEVKEVGAGLSLWSNAVKALRRLGVEGPVVERASAIERVLTLTSRGRLVSETDIGAISRAASAPSVCVHRADLQRALAKALGREALACGKSCIGFEQRPEKVLARFADGTEETGDLLVGADGIRSLVRERLLGDGAPRYAGYACWRGIGEGSFDALPPGTSLFALGSGTQVGLCRCGPTRVYWFATWNAPEGTAEGPRGRKADALARLAGWPDPIPRVVLATDERAILQSDIIDRPPAARWGEGRVTLLGDAAHATTPNLGQGACQALEDAVVLARCLHDSDHVEPALRAYERTRLPRANGVVRASSSLGKVFQWEGRIATWLRDRASATWLGRGRAEAILRDLLLYDPPELPRVGG